MKILNLDEISSDDKEITLGGEKYIVPGDMPVETMLRLMDNSSKIEKDKMNTEAFKEGVDIMVSLFKVRKPDVNIEKIKNDLTMKRYTALTQFLFGGYEEAEKKPDPAS